MAFLRNKSMPNKNIDIGIHIYLFVVTFCYMHHIPSHFSFTLLKKTIKTVWHNYLNGWRLKEVCWQLLVFFTRTRTPKPKAQSVSFFLFSLSERFITALSSFFLIPLYQAHHPRERKYIVAAAVVVVKWALRDSTLIT